MKITIDRLGHLGDGIAEGPIYAARTLPGEVLEGEPDGDRLTDFRILTPSDNRITPRCRHYKTCGGCALHHASDDFVARWKTGIIAQALAGQGVEAPLRPIHTAPPKSRRRAVFAGRRTKGGAMVGFHGKSSAQITAIPDCQILSPDILAALPDLEELTRLGATRTAEITLHVTASLAGLDILVQNAKPLDNALRQTLARWVQRPGLARLTWNDELIAEVAAPAQRFGTVSVTPPPGAFLQATPDAEATLVQAVGGTLKDCRTIVDLFSGCGTFALPLAAQAEVHAVEGSAKMLAALDKAWRHATGLKAVTTEARDLFRQPLLADELARFDGIVIDPPRAGAVAQIAQIAKARTGKVAMVSCNPVTFARDAKSLIDAGYTLNGVQPVDQFRWSTHIELVGAFTAS